jgi:hypothetical protein
MAQCRRKPTAVQASPTVKGSAKATEPRPLSSPPPETFEKFSRCGHFPSPMVTMDREGHGAVAGFNAGDNTRSARRVGLRK